MKTVFGILLLSVLSAFSQGNDPRFRYPIRVINGQRIDLSYLFSNWARMQRNITNSPWVLVNGHICGNDSGWVVDGKTDSISGLEIVQKVIVESPPLAERDLFEKLNSELSSLEADMVAINRQEWPDRRTYLSDSFRVEDLTKQLASIPHDSTQTGLVYRVQFIALWTGKTRNGMPILNFGTASY